MPLSGAVLWSGLRSPSSTHSTHAPGPDARSLLHVTILFRVPSFFRRNRAVPLRLRADAVAPSVGLLKQPKTWLYTPPAPPSIDTRRVLLVSSLYWSLLLHRALRFARDRSLSMSGLFFGTCPVPTYPRSSFSVFSFLNIYIEDFLFHSILLRAFFDFARRTACVSSFLVPYSTPLFHPFALYMPDLFFYKKLCAAEKMGHIPDCPECDPQKRSSI